MSSNAAPDSWDETDVADASVNDLQQKLPRLNVNAMEFVPSFGPSTAIADENGEGAEAVGDADKKTASECTPVLRLWRVLFFENLLKSPLISDADGIGDPLAGDTGGGASAAVLDSWEDGASITPEDGTAKPISDVTDLDANADIDLDDDEKPKPVPKKPVVESEPKPKKEHINIVIIGHVGKAQSFLLFLQTHFQVEKFVKFAWNEKFIVENNILLEVPTLIYCVVVLVW